MPITVNGISSAEIALADAGKSEVRVRIGDQTVVLGAAQGIDHPQSVMLAYLNNASFDAADPYPDLVVANSGGDNVLVFPGLAGGQFGPALQGLQGFSVGENPVNVTMADVNDDGVPDLLVANQGSNSVTILLGGTGVGSAWTSSTSETIAVGNQDTNTAPVKVLYVDGNRDGMGDILVCNSGSDNVYVYNGMGNGLFNFADPTIFGVGTDPIDMLYGQFDRRPQLDLVTVNSGSDDLTQIDGVFTANPTIQTVSSGGIMPDSAFAYATNQGGMMGLVVANSGDGHLAFLQPGNTGLQIAGVITPTDLPIPTAVASSAWLGSGSGSGIEFIAATAGQDAADLLRFDFSIGSSLLASPAGGLSPVGDSQDELIAGLMPFGESSTELLAVFWVGSPDQAALSGEWNLREPSSITALYSPTEGQGDGATTPTAEVSGSPDQVANGPTDPKPSEVFTGIKYVIGVDQRLNAFREPIEALADRDLPTFLPDRSFQQVVRLEDSPGDTLLNPDVESTEGAIDDVLLHLQRLEGQIQVQERNTPTDPSGPLEPARRREGTDTSANQGRSETVPLVSTVALFSARLILKASPPRPPSFRKGSRSKLLKDSGPKTQD
jgi:hypothetical protein